MMSKTRNFELVRQIGSLNVVQRTKDGMFNATELANEWQDKFGQEKRVRNFLANDQIKDYIKALAMDIENQEVPNSWKKSYLEEIENQDVAEHLNSTTTGIENQEVVNSGKKRYLECVENQEVAKQIICTTRGRNGATWMHPLLFVKFACWLNPNFEVQVMKAVMDKLIDTRNMLADSYHEWTCALARIGAENPEDYSRIQKCVNFAIFDKHVNDIRNFATLEQLNSMDKLEGQIIQLIEFGYIKSLEEVREFLRKVWEKNFPKPFSSCTVC
jgi:hypothetical protein